jgi:hypothetical protein
MLPESVSFYASVPSSLFTLAPGAARHLFIAWPWMERRRVQPSTLNIVQISPLPITTPLRSAS